MRLEVTLAEREILLFTPVKTRPKVARHYFKLHYNELFAEDKFEEYDWELTPDFNNLKLKVKLYAKGEDGSSIDNYYLLLDFSHYPEWPPSVKFVNPTTDKYEYPKDNQWVPLIVTQQQHIRIHLQHKYPDGHIDQLICNSMILEFYETNHNPSEDQKWNDDKTFFSTIHVISSILKRPHYGERHKKRR